MRTITRLSILLALALPARLFAGEIFGSITENGKPVGESVKIEITAANKSSYTDTTDKFGAYRVFVKEKGKCTFTIYYKEQTASAELFSYDKSLRYDWILEAKEGTYTLRRK
ncbi:MAG: hypothetical protein HY961_20940 [Ignavibacteriae bacterium]|nr:hypothetical protein [Ignavibacteriota bacterium]